MSDGGGEGKGSGSSGGYDPGNGSQSGTALAQGPAGASNANTVGAAVGGSNTPLFQIGGGSFSASDGTSPLGGITSSGGSPLAPTSSIANPAGITTGASGGAASALGLAPPVGFGSSPTDLSSNYDPLSGAQPGSAAPAPAAGTTPLTPDQMGGAIPGAKPTASGTAPAAGGGEKSVLDSLGIKNPLGAAIGAGGLAYAVSQGQQQSKYSPELLAQAQSLNSQGQQLLSYLNSGNLPPGLQASLTQATSAAKAKVISNFASQGQNTDPTQNTALAQTLLQIDQQALISTAQIGQQLMTSGIQETGLSSDLYRTLANIDQTQTANIGKAIAGFASSISGSGGGINIKLPGS